MDFEKKVRTCITQQHYTFFSSSISKLIASHCALKRFPARDICEKKKEKKSCREKPPNIYILTLFLFLNWNSSSRVEVFQD